MAKKGVNVNAYFNVSKARWYSPFQEKGLFFLVSVVRGFAKMESFSHTYGSTGYGDEGSRFSCVFGLMIFLILLG